MGGRGSGSGRGGVADRADSKPKSRFGNPVNLKTAKDIVPWVKHQSGVDLDKYRDSVTKGFDKKNQIFVDASKMSKTERRNLALLETHKGYKTNISTELSGTWLLGIKVKKK
jgi:hypothetical protein|nr:MAG TPA: hypothetical protein [Bacteriophage sp.]